jgi:hypothetical protein
MRLAGRVHDSMEEGQLQSIEHTKLLQNIFQENKKMSGCVGHGASSPILYS